MEAQIVLPTIRSNAAQARLDSTPCLAEERSMILASGGAKPRLREQWPLITDASVRPARIRPGRPRASSLSHAAARFPRDQFAVLLLLSPHYGKIARTRPPLSRLLALRFRNFPGSFRSVDPAGRV